MSAHTSLEKQYFFIPQTDLVMLSRNTIPVYYVKDETLIPARYRQNGEILNDKLGSTQCQKEKGGSR